MRRREFIALIGAAAASSRGAHAQQASVPVVGYLGFGSPEPDVHRVAAFRKGLSETGFIEGTTVSIQFWWARNQTDRVPELAAELVRHRVAVIATPGSTTTTRAAMAATATIPIVFQVAGDPVEDGLVANFSRPGGNVTGVTSQSIELAGKRVGLLRELLPEATHFALLMNPNVPLAERTREAYEAAATATGLRIEVVTAGTNQEIDAAFAKLAQIRPDAVLVSTSNLFNNRRVQIVVLATLHRLPTIYPWREAPEAGGLMSYGPSQIDEFRQVGVYAGRILKGEKPNDLPVMRPTKFEFVINLNTAKALGLTIPETLLATADEVIQ
jgi:putative ABC transport system substrate-binding protein